MRIKFYEKSSMALIVMLIIFALNFHHLEAQTNTQNMYSTLNTETRAFVNRLNQLPQNFTFNQTLKRGTPVSPDVQYLKWILNSDRRTALTDNPNMTLAELTSAFGPITEAAVKKFQTLYRSEILDPQGITNATGIVGKGTKTKLNWLLNQSRGIARSIDYNTVNNYAVVNNNNPSYNNNYVDFSYFNNQVSNTGNNGSTDSVQNSTSTESSTIYSTTSLDTSASANTTNNTSGGSNSNVSDSSSGALGALAIVGAAALLNGGAGAAGGAAADAAGSAAAGAATKVVVSQFGGRVIMNMPCPCSANYLITLFDLSLNAPLSVIFQPGVSMIKMNYNPTIGQSVLGGYIRGPAKCLVYVGTGCAPYGTPWGVIDTLRGIGTTLSPVSI